MSTVRLGKYLADMGLASRRAVPKLLHNHEVRVNGEKTTNLSLQIDPEKDTVLLNGKQIKPATLVYFLINKPKGVLSTVIDKHKRNTVVSLIQTDQRIYPVGRLDMDTTGLLLLTNDGELAYKLTHPKFHIPKTYHLTIAGKVPDKEFTTFRKGMLLDDGKTQPAQTKIIKQTNNQTLVAVVLHEGRKRQIRRMCQAQNLDLLELERVAIGPIKIGDLKLGEYRKLTNEEIAKLKKQ